MNSYEPYAIETRWQAFWNEHRTFRAANPGDADFDPQAPKYYVLDMFPYPSGAGLHVGHPMGYIGSDIVARRKRMEGMNVLHPMGYDAFGLPAEQYAITTGKHPAETTAANIANFRRQLQGIGLSYDWERELSTCDPKYYRWTQWIFGRLFDRGLAYQAEVPVWWCEALKTVLANEEVINGKSERGDHPCERRPLKQWMLCITAYADRLVDDLELVDWPESVKAMQREWIGRSEGALIDFPLAGHPGRMVVFTTRPDTVCGATFMVVAPEHELVARVTTRDRKAAVEAYVRAAATKTDLQRTDLAKDKSGVFTGAYCQNPLLDPSDRNARIPVWVADYVLASYGTGAIMAVPGHDVRDFEFATKFGLPIREVVRPPAGEPGLEQGVCFTGDGTAVNSPAIDGLPTPEAKRRTIALLAEKGLGRAKTSYRLRDWLFSRQRYWGEPFPVLHTDDGRTLRVPDEELPVELPPMADFTPAEDGSAPLARAKAWVRTTAPDGTPARRDTDTMPGWAGSCWYYLRFMDVQNDAAPFDPLIEHYWGSVDLYVGGVEHAVLHLLYARFWHKVLYDEGVVSTKEPFTKLFNQGMVTAFAFKDASGRLVPSDEVTEESLGGFFRRTESAAQTTEGMIGGYIYAKEPVEQVVAKMSKSLRNVVNPDEVIAEYGVDTFRLYEMFMGPLGDSKPWNPRDVPGCRRFLDRVWRMLVEAEGADAGDGDGGPAEPRARDGGVLEGHDARAVSGAASLRADLLPADAALAGETLVLEKSLHRMLQRIDDSFAHMNFNTAVAAMMTFVNDASKRPGALTRAQAERFVLALSPFAPHLGEELWSRLGHAESLARAPWPSVDARFLCDDEVEIAVQVKGKVRGRAMVPAGADPDAHADLARAAVASHLEGVEVLKTIVVPGKLVNFVVR